MYHLLLHVVLHAMLASCIVFDRIIFDEEVD